MTQEHPLTAMLMSAAAGRFPSADGLVELAASPAGCCHAVVAFTAHHMVAADLDHDVVLARLDPEDVGAPMGAEFLAWRAERLETSAGMLELVMVAPTPSPGEALPVLVAPTPSPGEALPVMVAPTPSPGEALPVLVRREGMAGHPRLERSRRYRTDLRCYSDRQERALVAIGRGLAERWELAIEIGSEYRGRGLGTELARAAARLMPSGEPLFAQVSPGNVASVRAFLAAGYRPVCSEVLFLKKGW
jgi:hypothetical protein